MKLFWNINDLELIYLIKERNEVAYNLMYKKYLVLIGRLVGQMGAKGDLRDELIQEGLIHLEIAIYSFDEKYGRSFHSFFEFTLKRRLYRVLYKNIEYNNRLVLIEDYETIPSVLQESESYYLPIKDIKFKNETDRLIYNEIILSNRSIKSLCDQHNLEPKKVYNRVYKFKSLYKGK